MEGQIVPLVHPPQNGQRVEILTVKEGGPSINWLHDGWVVSHRAISKIRQWIRQQNAHIAIDCRPRAVSTKNWRVCPACNPIWMRWPSA